MLLASPLHHPGFFRTLCRMNTHPTPRQRHKPGPKPMAADRVKASFVLARELWDWAAEQPEGASRLLRELLAHERERREAPPAVAPAVAPATPPEAVPLRPPRRAL